MRKEQVGTVLSDKMPKTRIVRVERLVRAPLYRKILRVRHKFCVHDEQNLSKAGDKVRIQETRPLSRRKRWKIVEIVK